MVGFLRAILVEAFLIVIVDGQKCQGMISFIRTILWKKYIIYIKKFQSYKIFHKQILNIIYIYIFKKYI